MKARALASKFLRRIRLEAGDTLIEVTMALSILSMVLISSTVIAAQAFRLGQTARERTTVSTAAQAQMEAVRAFRDNNSWDHFLHGTAAYHGMLTAVSPAGCSTSVACMHMVAGANPTFTPVDGVMSGPVPTSNLEIVTAPGPSPDVLVVTVNYWFDTLGSGKAMGHIKTYLSNLQSGPAATPAPVALPCSNGVNDIVLVMDTSSSMGPLFPWDNGQSREWMAQQVATSFVDSIQLSARGNHIAVIGFDDVASVYTGFTSNPVKAKSAINSMVINPQTHYMQGLQAAAAMFQTPQSRSGANKVMIFESDGLDGDNSYTNSASAPGITKELNTAFPNPVDVYTVGINPNGDDMSLLNRVMPRRAGFYSDAKISSQLQAAYAAMSGMIACQ